MKNVLCVCLILCIGFMASSCALMFKGTSEEVAFQSSPDRAQVYVEGELMGETPLAIKLESKKSYTIVFKAEGYKDQSYHIKNKIGAGWVVLDILSFWLVPVIIDAATGAWYSLDQKNINAVLQKQQ